MIDSPECNKIEGEKQPPTIVIIRLNIFEKMEVVYRFVGEDAIRNINIDKLNDAIEINFLNFGLEKF